MSKKTRHLDQPLRVMLVEDEPLLRTIARCVLERKGKARVVAQASTGEAAVQMYREARPDVVVMDIHMPGAGGIVATSVIVSQDSAARIIIWSSDARDTRVRQAREAGALGFVDKLGPNEVLAQAMHQVSRGLVFFGPGLLLSGETERAGHEPPRRGARRSRETWSRLSSIPMPCPLLAQEM